MSVSTKESISIGLAHEFIVMLTRHGVTRRMIQDALQNQDRLGGKIVMLFMDPTTPLGKGNSLVYVGTTYGPGSDPRDRSIGSLSLTPHAYDCLVHSSTEVGLSLKTVDHLLCCTVAQLMSIPGMDSESIDQIQGALVRWGYPAIKTS